MASSAPPLLLSQSKALSNVRLVLASQSPRRKEIFNLLGLEGNFEVKRLMKTLPFRLISFAARISMSCHTFCSTCQSLKACVTADIINATITYTTTFPTYMIYWSFNGDCVCYGYWCGWWYGLVVVNRAAVTARNRVRGREVCIQVCLALFFVEI